MKVIPGPAPGSEAKYCGDCEDKINMRPDDLRLIAIRDSELPDVVAQTWIVACPRHREQVIRALTERPAE